MGIITIKIDYVISISEPSHRRLRQIDERRGTKDKRHGADFEGNTMYGNTMCVANCVKICLA